jgi:hypothetical protein
MAVRQVPCDIVMLCWSKLENLSAVQERVTRVTVEHLLEAEHEPHCRSFCYATQRQREVSFVESLKTR